MTEEHPTIAKKLLESEGNMTPITVTTHEVTYIANNNDGNSVSQAYVNIDEEVEVEENIVVQLHLYWDSIIFCILASYSVYGMLFMR